MDIPSLFMIPSAVSSGKVHSVFPNSTDADFDFNRDSSATRVNSQGLIETVGYFGSELVTNGDFSSGSSGWTLSTTPPELRGNSFLFNSSSNFIFRSWSNVSGRTYRINFQGTGDVRYRTGFSGSDGTIRAISLPTIVEFEATSNTNRIQIYGATSGTGVLDSVSIKEVTGDRARLNYEIEGGLVNTKPSLLLEPQSTNIITQSEDFSGYFNGNIRIESNQIVAPDGVSKSSKLSKTTFFQNIQLVATVSNSTNYSLSVFAKKGTLNRITLRLASGSNDVRKSLDLSDLSVSNAGGNQTGFVSSKVEELANDWYRFSITATSGGTSQFINIYAGKGDVDESGNIYIWGAQFEEQSYPTSYIPTNGSVQTRTSETCTGAGTSSIFESSEGILYAEIAALADDLTFRGVSLSDGSYSNRCVLRYGGTSNRTNVLVSSGGSTVFDNNSTSLNILDFNKIAVKWKANDFAFWINGVEVATDTSGAAPIGLLQLQFADSINSGGFFYGKVRDIRVYNTKEMTDSEVDILLTKITS